MWLTVVIGFESFQVSEYGVLGLSVEEWVKELHLISFILIKDTRAEGRGRVARIQRRLLIVEVEKTIMKYLAYLDQQHVRSLVCS
ncbi:hypothetical protein SLEP1_g17429 [Rubroshorea leprosula]|uniref:Uncharacterized protein n=1 Tax=Rubroshorea leprosula TaxID=152421 RepID=A0AAV5J3B3_9ROSI|nr:hypothetical protein SLEP1_g17429 [Rubroshorea leprosula]